MVKRSFLQMMCGWLVAAALAKEGPQNQRAMTKVEGMPNLPRHYQMRDWKAVALGFDRLVFNVTAKGEYLPVVQLTVTAGVTNFAMPSYVGPKPGSRP